MIASAWLYLDYGQMVLAALTFVAAFVVVASATFITQRLLTGQVKDGCFVWHGRQRWRFFGADLPCKIKP